MNKKYITNDEASEIITQLGVEFAVVNNPENIFPAFEIYPLAPKITAKQKNISAVLLNMEGIFISTENLHLHSLEYMVRQFSGRFEKSQWHGLDKIIDYPGLLGDSSTNPVEFLVQRYHNYIKPDFFAEAFMHSILWILILGHDESWKKKVYTELAMLGYSEILNDPKLSEYIALKEFNKYNANVITNYFIHKYNPVINIQNFAQTVSAARFIYNRRYQEILEVIKLGEGANLAEEIFETNDISFIRPNPGAALFLALCRGWLGDDVKYLFDDLGDSLKTLNSIGYLISDKEAALDQLLKLSSRFEAHPLKTALVSSQNHYSTSILISESLNLLAAEVRKWKLPEARKSGILEKFSHFADVFDTIITKNDISPIRKKPHPDAYSIAITRLGFDRSRFNEIIGIENSENGIISLRSSGIGLSLAFPPPKSQSLSFAHSVQILQGGFPELILNHNCYISL